jgi:hypothetical protein
MFKAFVTVHLAFPGCNTLVHLFPQESFSMAFDFSVVDFPVI